MFTHSSSERSLFKDNSIGGSSNMDNDVLPMQR